MADITIHTQDPSTSTAGAVGRRRGRGRRTVLLGAFVLGGLVGSATAVALTGGDGGSRAEGPATTPAPTSAAPAVRADAATRGGFTSADAMARWAEAERRARIELCTSAPGSADALARCLGDRG